MNKREIMNVISDKSRYKIILALAEYVELNVSEIVA